MIRLVFRSKGTASTLERHGGSKASGERAAVDRLLTSAIYLTACLLVLCVAGLAAYWYVQHYVYSSLSVEDRDAHALEDQIRQQPNNPGLRVAIANLFVDKGSYDDAVSQAEQALLLSHDNQAALLALGEAYAGKGDLASAASNLSRIVELNKNNSMAGSNLQLAQAHQSLGGIFLKQNRTADAEKELLQALQIDGGNADTLRLLGNAQAQQGRVDEAIKSYQQAVRLVPDFSGAYEDLLQAYGRQGDENHAEYARGMVDYTRADYSSALDELTQAERALPNAAEVHLGLAMTYEKQGKRTSALDEYRKAAQLDGNSVAAKQGLGRLGGE